MVIIKGRDTREVSNITVTAELPVKWLERAGTCWDVGRPAGLGLRHGKAKLIGGRQSTVLALPTSTVVAGEATTCSFQGFTTHQDANKLLII